MKNLTLSQLKVLSEFFNTIAAAWFSAGVISPFFIKPESVTKTIAFGTVAIILSIMLLILSLRLVKRIKI